MLKIIRVLILLLPLILGLTEGKPAFGQGGATGAISGTVVDVNGGAVAAADVQIINSATDELVRRLTSGADGTFEAVLLPPAKYYVVVNKSGFAEAKAANIEVRVTETTRMTIPLKPGTVTEKIEISAQVTSVETTNATTGETIGSETIRDLPLATQNYQQLLSLSTGVQSELNQSTQLGRGTTKIYVNGQREDNNNYLIEGISATDYNVAQNYYVPLPNPDVIQEFKVQTSLYDASQGRNGGGNVNAILKTGTRELHGDVYEFFRNDALNANEYFHNATGQARPPVKQNLFGVSVGGPVVKEKFGYFFVNYQGTRQRSALSPGTAVNNPGFPVIPADRSEASISQAFFGNTTTAIDPLVLKLLNFKGSNNLFNDPNGFLIPSIAGTPGTTGPLLVSKPGKYTDDQFTTNWDKEFNASKDKVGARFFFSNSETNLPFGAGGLQASLGGTLQSSISATDLDFPFDIPVAARFLSINETHLFTPVLVNDFRFGYIRMNYSLLNSPPVTAADLGIDRPSNNITQSIYKFTFNTSGFQIGPTPPADQFQVQNNFNFVDTVSWVKGPHDFRFGAEYTRVNLDKKFPQTFNGQIFFNNGGGFTDWQNFLQGIASFSFGGGGVYNHNYHTNVYGLFAQDDWKVTRNLTVNLGARVDINGAFYDSACHIGNIDENLAAQDLYPMVYGGCANKLNVPGLSGKGNDSTFNNAYATGLAPRVGLAYDLGGHHNTTIRAGYGIYYVREDVGTADQLSFQAPYLPIVFGALPPGCLSVFFSNSANFPANCLLPGNTTNFTALADGGDARSEFHSLPSRIPRIPTARRNSGTRRRHHAGRAIRLRFRKPRLHPDAVPLHAGRPAALCHSEHAAVEPDLAERPWQGLGSRGRVCWHTHRSPARDPHEHSREDCQPDGSDHGDGREREFLPDHAKHHQQRAAAQPHPGHQRIRRLSDFRQLRLRPLPLAAGDGVAALGTRLFPSGLYLVQVHGRGLQRKHGVEHCVQRRIEPEEFLRPFRLRPHAPLCGELPVRPAALLQCDRLEENGIRRLVDQRNHGDSVRRALYRHRLRCRHRSARTRIYTDADG